MPVVRFAKVVSSLPTALSPDTVYFVRAGSGFDLYLSDMTGTVAHKLNGASGSSGGITQTVLAPKNPLTQGDTYSSIDVTTPCRSLYDHTATNVELQLSDSSDFSTNLYTHTWPDNSDNTLLVTDIPIDYGDAMVYTRLRHTNVLGDLSDWSEVVGVYFISGVSAKFVRLRTLQVFSSSGGYEVLSSMQIYDDSGNRIYNFAPLCGPAACRAPAYALDDSVGYGSTAWGGPTAAAGEYIGWDFSAQSTIPVIAKFKFWASSSYPLPEFAVDVSDDGVNWTTRIPQLGCGGYGGANGQWWVYDVATGQITYEP